MDNEEVTRLYTKYRRPIFAYVYRMLNDSMAAEDVTNDTFLRLKATDNVQYPPSWLQHVAYHLVVDHIRAHKREVELPLYLPVWDNTEVRHYVQAGIAHLTAPQRQALYLRYWLQLDNAEAGRIMGRSDKAVEQLHHRAKEKLKEVLR